MCNHGVPGESMQDFSSPVGLRSLYWRTMLERISRRDGLAISGVLALALAVRLIYLWQFSQLPDWSQLTVDNWYHHNWASTIATGNIIGDTTYFRAPFYVWCLSLVYAAFGVSLWAARLFGIAVGVCSVAFTYLIARRLAGHRVGIIAALIGSFYPFSLMFEAELLLDPLFTLLVQVFVYSLLRWSENPSPGRFFLSSAIGGVAALTRPTILAVVPLVIMLMIWRLRRSPASMAKHLAVCVVGLAITVGVVFCRNLVVAGDPVLIASQGGVNFYIGNNDSADGLSASMPEPLGHNWRMRDITFIAERELSRKLKPGEVSSYWTNRATGWILDHPGRFLALTFKRLWFSIANIEISNNRLIDALFERMEILRYNPIRFGVVFTLAIAGMFISWNRRPAVRWLVGGVIWFTVVNALFFYNSRFRLPLIPLYFILAALALEHVSRHYRNAWRDWRIALIAAIAAVLSFAPLYNLSPTISTQDLRSKGLMLYNQGDFAEALAFYRAAASFDETAPETNLNIGATMLKLGLVDSATVYFEKEISLHPNRAKGYANLAAVRLVQGRFSAARTLAGKSLSLRPYDPAAWVALLRASAQDSSLKIDSLREMAVKAGRETLNSPWVCVEAGSALELRGDLNAAALMYLEGTRATDPPLETDDRLFEQTYEQNVARDIRERARANMAYGSLLGRRGEYAQSAIYSSAAISLDSTLSGAWINLVSAHANLGQNPEAASILNQAMRRFPEDPVIQRMASRSGP